MKKLTWIPILVLLVLCSVFVSAYDTATPTPTIINETDNTAIVYSDTGTISIDKFEMGSNEEAIISFNKNNTETLYDLCIKGFVGYEEMITLSNLKKDVSWWFDENLLNDIEKEGELYCFSSFEAGDVTDIRFKADYVGEGKLKYDIYILPTKYNKDFELATEENELIILDPYLIGEELEAVAFFGLDFDNNLIDLVGSQSLVTNNVTPNITTVNTDYTTFTYGRTFEIDGYLDKINISYNVTGGPSVCANYYAVEFNYTDGTNQSHIVGSSPPSPVGSTFMVEFINPDSTKEIGTVRTKYAGAGCGANLPQTITEIEVNFSQINITLEGVETKYFVTDSLVANYMFKYNENSADISKNSNNGIDTSATYTDSGLICDGANTVVTPTSLIDLGTEFTVFLDDIKNLGGHAYAPDSTQFLLNENLTTGNGLYYSTTSGNIGFQYTSGGQYSTVYNFNLSNSVTDFMVRFNTTHSDMFVDGVLVKSDVIAGTGLSDWKVKEICSRGGILYANFSIGNIMLYDSALTNTEIFEASQGKTFVNDSINETMSAFRFDGNGGLITDSDDLFDVSGSDNFSVSLFMRFDNVSQYMPIFYKGGVNSSTANYGYGLDTSHRLFYYAGFFSDPYITLEPDKWYNMIFTQDSNFFNVYVDNILVGSRIPSGRVPNDFNLMFGTSLYQERNFIGEMDEIRFFNKVLDESERSILYAGFDSLINFSFYDSDELTLLNGLNITLDITSNGGYDETFYIINGTKSIYGVPNGTLNIEVSADGYDTLTTSSLIELNTINNISLFLTNSSLTENTVIFTVSNSVTSALVENVDFLIERNVNNNWVQLEDKTTDITGRIQFAFVEDGEYRFTLSKDGFIEKTFTLNPILFSAYSVKIVPDNPVQNTIQDAGIYVDFTPKQFTLNDTGSLILTIDNPMDELINYSLTTIYGEDTVTSTGTNSDGGTLSNSYNLSNNSITYFVIRYDYYSNIVGYKSFSYPFKINNVTEGATIANLGGNTYGLGLFERILIVVLFSLVVGGIVSLVGGAIAGGAIGLFVSMIFAYIGFISWWLLWPSLIAGFIIIFKGGQN